MNTQMSHKPVLGFILAIVIPWMLLLAGCSGDVDYETRTVITKQQKTEEQGGQNEPAATDATQGEPKDLMREPIRQAQIHQWTEEIKRDFIVSCKGNETWQKVNEKTAHDICECILNRIMTRYPDPTLSAEMPQAWVQQANRECQMEVLTRK